MGKNKVMVSVVIGVYDPEKEKLKKALYSIVKQTFKDWELILYDDGSKSRDAAFIRKLCEKDERFVYIRQKKNHGLAYALNVCIRQAKGKYIARMDADDICEPKRFETQYQFLETHPKYQWVGSNAELMDKDGVWGYQKMPKIPKRTDFLFNSPYLHPTVMFRRTVLKENHGYCSASKWKGLEDYELFMRLHKNGNHGYNIQESLLKYWEDYHSHQKRTYMRRIREMFLRIHGFRLLGIFHVKTLPYVVKPLLVGAIPAPLHHYIRKKRKKMP